jgi:hypothetical protein
MVVGFITTYAISAIPCTNISDSWSQKTEEKLKIKHKKTMSMVVMCQLLQSSLVLVPVVVK